MLNLYVWKKCLTLQGQLDHDSGVNCQFVDDNCTILVTGTKEGMVYIWDMTTLYPIAEHNSKYLVDSCFDGYDI